MTPSTKKIAKAMLNRMSPKFTPKPLTEQKRRARILKLRKQFLKLELRGTL